MPVIGPSEKNKYRDHKTNLRPKGATQASEGVRIPSSKHTPSKAAGWLYLGSVKWSWKADGRGGKPHPGWTPLAKAWQWESQAASRENQTVAWFVWLHQHRNCSEPWRWRQWATWLSEEVGSPDPRQQGSGGSPRRPCDCQSCVERRLLQCDDPEEAACPATS